MRRLPTFFALRHTRKDGERLMEAIAPSAANMKSAQRRKMPGQVTTLDRPLPPGEGWGEGLPATPESSISLQQSWEWLGGGEDYSDSFEQQLPAARSDPSLPPNTATLAQG